MKTCELVPVSNDLLRFAMPDVTITITNPVYVHAIKRIIARHERQMRKKWRRKQTRGWK